jgi:glucose-1-phosphate thymidylyltransferase
MNIIIPMAGMGKRLRPHTLTTAKPLIKVCGQEIVKILCKEIVKTCGVKVDNIGFVIGDFGEQVEKDLINVAESLGAKGLIFHQDIPLGTAHAIWCAKDILQGPTVVAFADTLFDASFTMDLSVEGIIWTSCVENPQQFGVVKKDSTGKITGFVEKPKEFVSNEAIIGIYYFREGERLYNEIKRLIDNNIVHSNEYQLTDALDNMLQNGFAFRSEQVKEWLDCGNKDAVVNTNQRLLCLNMGLNTIDSSLKETNSKIIEPCYIGKNVVLEDSVVGPYVSIEDNTIVKQSIIKNTIIAHDSVVENAILLNSMLSNNTTYKKQADELSLGAFSTIK